MDPDCSLLELLSRLDADLLGFQLVLLQVRILSLGLGLTQAVQSSRVERTRGLCSCILRIFFLLLLRLLASLLL